MSATRHPNTPQWSILHTHCISFSNSHRGLLGSSHGIRSEARSRMKQQIKWCEAGFFLESIRMISFAKQNPDRGTRTSGSGRAGGLQDLRPILAIAPMQITRISEHAYVLCMSGSAKAWDRPLELAAAGRPALVPPLEETRMPELASFFTKWVRFS